MFINHVYSAPMYHYTRQSNDRQCNIANHYLFYEQMLVLQNSVYRMRLFNLFLYMSQVNKKGQNNIQPKRVANGPALPISLLIFI